MTQQSRIVLASTILIFSISLLVLNPSMLTTAQAQMYNDQYGYDNNYYQDDHRYGYDNNHQKKSSHTDIQKIKCVNSNINVNGIDITKIPEDTTATTASANEAGPAGANTQNGNGFDKINFNKNLVNICINVNDNEQIKVSAPEEANLLVTKTVSCEPVDPDSTSGLADRICDEITGVGEPTQNEIEPNEFTIIVSGISANPSIFEGSATGQDVTVGAGTYVVSEIEDPTVQQTILAIEAAAPSVTIDGPEATFGEDCDAVTGDPDKGTGTIAAGQSQTCEITNQFVIEELDCINSDINNSAC